MKKKTNKTLAFLLALAMSAMPLYAQENSEPPAAQTAEEKGKEDIKNAAPQSTFTIGSYDILDKNGESIRTIEKGKPFTLVFDAIDTSISTKDALEKEEIGKINQTIHSLNIIRLPDGFSKGNDPQVVLLSKEQEPLKVKVVIKDLTWKGKSDQFKFRIGYAALDISYTDQIMTIDECSSTPAKDDETPAEDQTTDESMSGIADSGSYYGNSDAGTPTPIKSAAPNLIVKQYSYGKDPIYSGSEFELRLEFYNTSKTIAAENIVVSLETGEGLSIANSSNTFYFETLAPQASQVIKIKMKALAAEKNSSPTIDVGFRYDFVDDGERMNQQMAEKIAIPVYLKDRFEIDDPLVPETAAAGSECALSFNYVNKGKGSVSNVEAVVEGDIPALQKTQHIGNIDPGSSGSIDVILIPDHAGMQKGTIVITYENANEDVVEQKFPFELNVTEPEPVTFDENSTIEEEQKSSFPWIPLLVVLIGAAIAVVVFRKHKKKKMKAASHEEEDLHFDDEDDQ